MDRRIKLSRTDVFLLVLTVLFLLTVGAVYLLTPHTVRKDYTVEAQVPVEAPADGQRAICQSGAAAGGGRHRTGHAGRAA